jgi:predicted membrane-bound dolichyl-phosphate-mannose-protein mannosyltransferase
MIIAMLVVSLALFIAASRVRQQADTILWSGDATALAAVADVLTIIAFFSIFCAGLGALVGHLS